MDLPYSHSAFALFCYFKDLCCFITILEIYTLAVRLFMLWRGTNKCTVPSITLFCLLLLLLLLRSHWVRTFWFEDRSVPNKTRSDLVRWHHCAKMQMNWTLGKSACATAGVLALPCAVLESWHEVPSRVRLRYSLHPPPRHPSSPPNPFYPSLTQAMRVPLKGF